MATGKGRNTLYTDKLADEICEMISNTSFGLERISEHFNVDRSQITRWLQKYPEFRIKYTRAKEEQADYLAEEIMKISDDASKDLISGQFGEMPNSAAIARAKLQIDTRKWLMSKLKPKSYSDKIDVNVGGQDGNPLVVHTIPQINIMNPNVADNTDETTV